VSTIDGDLDVFSTAVGPPEDGVSFSDDITLNGTITIDGAAPASVFLDAPVDITGPGTLQNNGVLVADKVKQRGSQVRIHAEIAAPEDIDVEGGVVYLLGIPVTVSGSLRFEDDRSGDDDLDLAALRAGDFLEVRGVDDGAGGV